MDSNIRAEVVSIGPELVLGQILDKPFPPSELCERAKVDFQADLVLALPLSRRKRAGSGQRPC